MASNGVFYSNTSGLNLNSNTTTRINISTGGVIQFNSAYTFPTSDGSANTVLLTNGSGALSFSTIPNASLDNSSLTVTAGNGLANGGSVSLGGSVTLNVGEGDGITVNANDISLDYSGPDNFVLTATDGTSTTLSSTDFILYSDGSSEDVTYAYVADLPFTNNSGTVTSVGITAGALIDVSNSPITTSGNITVAVDLSELTTSTTDGDGDFFAVIDTSNVQRKLTKGNINISGFNNDAGYTTNTGTVTSVAISGTDGIDVDSGSPITGSGTIQLGLSNVPNSSLANSSFTVNAPSGSDPVVPLGGTLNFTSSDSSVVIDGNSTTDTIDLTVGTSVDTFVTGGTFTSGTLSLGLNDGSSASDISGFWTSIPNSALANSSITIAGSVVSLGGSITGDDIISDVSAGQIANSQLANSSITVSAGSGLANGGSVSLGGTVTLNVGAGTGIQVNANDVALDYAGTNNFIDSATDLEGTDINTADTIVYHDATDNNVKKGLVSDLPFSNNSGTVTSVAISGTDGIDVDSGSPITTSGTIQLGLSNVPNSSLANSSITINGSAVSLGGTINIGDITEVVAGTGLTGGGSTGSVTLNVDYAGTDNYILAAGAGTGDIQTSWHIAVSNASNNVDYYDVLALPFTNNQGTVTSVGITAGALIDVSNSPITTSGNITVAVDLSELATSTSNGDGDFFVVVDSANAQKKLTKGNINNSGFNNDAGYITSAGNTNIYNTSSTLSANRLVTQGGFSLDFRATSNEIFQVYNSNTTPGGVPRVRFEADDTYTSVLELKSSIPSTFLIDGYDAGGGPVFNVDGNGNLFAVSKSFLIEHPTKEAYNLRHGSLEGPEHGVYVRGKLDGNNTIELPDYWLALVDEDSITVQLTPIGSHQNLYVKDIVDNKVIVGNSALLSSKIKCFYFVQAERKDIDKMVVEYPRETPTL